MYCLMQKYTRGYILPKNRTQNYIRGIILWVGIFLPVTPVTGFGLRKMLAGT